MEEQEEPKTAERKTHRPMRVKKKLRKLNDSEQLEVVHVSSDYNTMRLRPTGQVDSRNKKSRRVRAGFIYT